MVDGEMVEVQEQEGKCAKVLLSWLIPMAGGLGQQLKYLLITAQSTSHDYQPT